MRSNGFFTDIKGSAGDIVQTLADGIYVFRQNLSVTSFKSSVATSFAVDYPEREVKIK